MYKNRIVVYLEEKILQIYSLKFHHSEWKYMQHNHRSNEYLLYVHVSCVSGRWNWWRRNPVQLQAECSLKNKNHFRLKICFSGLVFNPYVWRFHPDHLRQPSSPTSTHAYINIVLTELFFFLCCLFFSARSANMMYFVSCCCLFLLVLLSQAPWKNVPHVCGCVCVCVWLWGQKGEENRLP